MTGDLDAAETDLFRSGVRRLLAACDEQDGDRWRGAAQLGVAGLGGDAGDLQPLRIAMEEAGAAMATLPLLGAAVANRLLHDRPDAGEVLAALADGHVRVAVAFGALDGDPLGGGVRVAAGVLHGTLGAVEGAVDATHLLVLAAPDRACLVTRDQPSVRVAPAAGVTAPDLAAVTFDGARGETFPVGREAMETVADLARLLLIARAWGAARRALALAIDYAGTREQFGQPIGRFQAIQHKLADARVRLDLVEALLLDAAAAVAHGADAAIAVAVLVAAASPALRRNALEVQHVFGAIGFAAEHDAAGLFVRVHADTVRLGGVRRARGVIADRLRREGALVGPDGRREPAPLARRRRQVRAWLAEHWTDEAWRDPARGRDLDRPFLHALREAGWLTANWPAAAGGPGFDALEQFALLEELRGAGAPMTVISPTHWVVAPAIIEHASEALRAAVLPPIAAGEMSFALGYSEPHAGSDLAALTTRARREGDDYLVDGQKIWTSNTEHATHLFLAARTGAGGGRKQDGISLFIVPLDAPGVTVRRVPTLHGKTFATVFLDAVRVPAAMLVGTEGQGWRILTGALGAERVIMGGQVASMRRLFDAVVRELRSRGPATDDAAVWATLADLAAELEGARAMALRAVERVQRGEPSVLEGAVAKLYSGDLAERLCEAVVDVAGVEALLGRGDAGALLDGEVSQQLRTAIMLVVGGGTAEIQRTLIHRQLAGAA